MGVYISESYDENIKNLEEGANVAYIPLVDGVYKSVFFPTTKEAAENAREDPVKFAVMACQKTKEYAKESGYEPR